MKTKQTVIYETAEDVVRAMTGELKSEHTPPPEAYLVFENEFRDVNLSGYKSNDSIFEIDGQVTGEDVLREMAKRLNFQIHIT